MKREVQRLHLDLTPQQREELEELRVLTGAKTYLQVMLEAMQRHLNVARDQKNREDNRRVYARNTMKEL